VWLVSRTGTRLWAQATEQENMSVRNLTYRLLHSLWRGVNQGQNCGGSAKENIKRVLTIEGAGAPKQNGRSRGPGGGKPRGRTRSTGPTTLPNHSSCASGFNFSAARRSLVDNVLKRVTNSQAAILRRRAAHQLSSLGNSAPFLALVGVSLASGAGIITKEDELESVCYEIRQTVAKTGFLHSSFDVEQECGNVDEKSGDATNIKKDHVWSLADFKVGKHIAKGCSAVVFSARLAEGSVVDEEDVATDGGLENHGGSPSANGEMQIFPLAIKMMFNYHAESNAFTILRAMHRETVPARNINISSDVDSLYQSLDANKARVPPHPNIVDMMTVFADQVPCLSGDLQLYGDALPVRLNPSGCGRNMSLFLVMKRYDCSLKEYLERYRNEISSRTSLILLTQLLEGISFLVESGVAHRDLKCDNLLLDLSGGAEFPQLVITDFGCCLADTYHGLRLPYRSFDTDKGGNAALMAPEVAIARPGSFTNINYEKADLWTAGTIAYEIFGEMNPFYARKDGRVALDSRTYSQTDLPILPASVPALVSTLVYSILSREPANRPSPRLAATLCQLMLWAPSSWCRENNHRPPDTQAILQWLLTMTTKVLCESRWGNVKAALFEYQLVATFLVTMSLSKIRAALYWIQDNLE